MTRIRHASRQNLLLTASAAALMLGSTVPAVAQDAFRRAPRDPAAQAAQAAAQRATQNQAASTATRRTIEAFSRAAQARQQMDAAQAAARAQAMAVLSLVPNGLAPNGLRVANGVQTDPSLWIGANAPTQTNADGRTRVEVDQTEAKAILSWDSFNIGRETDLIFDQQGKSTWAVLNRVTDVNADPSRILGSIRADGTVMILNRNGVIFGGSSQVNARNIVAAAATMTNDQFLTRGIYSAPNGNSYLPSFTDAGGSVTVQAGARLITDTPSNVLDGGGNVLLMGKSIENAGTIIAPKGQALLAAGEAFHVRPGVGTEANQYSTTRGNEVRALIDADSPAGAVTNTGWVEATQGDITLTGRTILQDGILLTTTSVNQRGTIHLSTSVSDMQGSVTLTGDSLTAILPELDSGDTALNSQRDALIAESGAQDLARLAANPGSFDNLSKLADRRDQGRVEIVSGGEVSFEADSTTLAQGGQVAVSATRRIQAEDNAIIDVSGVRGVPLEIGSNAIMVNIQGNELRDSPINRDAEGTPLFNQDVWVDARDLVLLPSGTGGYASDRYYTGGGLLEVGGYLANTSHVIGEWSAVGGTITLAADEVVSKQNAVFNIAGGSLDYTGSSVLSTRLQGIDGKLYDINEAPAGMQFVSVGRSQVVEHDRWGQQYTEVYSNAMFNRGIYVRHEDDYTVGRDAGRLILSTPTALFYGEIVADVVTGARQTSARPDGLVDGYMAPQDSTALPGGLVLGNFVTRYNGNPGAGLVGLFYNLDPVANSIVFGETSGFSIQDPTDPIPDGLVGVITFDSDRLNDFGLGSIVTGALDSVIVNDGLEVAPSGEIALYAPLVTVNADLTARSGSIALGNIFATLTENGNASERVLSPGADMPAGVLVANGATLDARGLWTNLLLGDGEAGALAGRNGGDVVIRSTGDVTLAEGALVDVSSGAALLADGSFIGGTGGDVTLGAGAYASDSSGKYLVGSGVLTLDGELRAFGVDGGGTLAIETARGIMIGGSLSTADGILDVGETSLVNLRLTNGYEILAGEIIPADIAITVDRWLPGAAFAVDVTPMVSATQPLVTAADWKLGNPISAIGIDRDGNLVQYSRFSDRSVVPAGTMIIQIGTIYASLPPSYQPIPPSVFPDGIPIAPAMARYAAGAIAPQLIHLDSGEILPAGSLLPRSAQVDSTGSLSTDLFQRGFANYAINSQDGIIVAEGATIDAVTPVYRPTAAAFSTTSGTDPATALELWLPPLYQEDPVAARLTQRTGASVSLTSGSPVPASVTAPLVVGSGAAISVDPGQTIAMRSNGGQVTIDGRLTAPGGTISILTVRQNEFNTDLSRSVWIGATAVLDVAGRSYVAYDRQGRAYGIALDGGSIDIGLSDAYVVVQPGALLDASGSSAEIDIGAGRQSTPSQMVLLAGDGGSIALRSYNGMFLDGEFRGEAGGPGAAGGSLTLAMDNRIYETASTDDEVLHSITLVQDRPESRLSDFALPGRPDHGLQLGNAVLSVEQVETGGFDSLTLSAHDLLVFDGDVNLNLGRSLALEHALLVPAASTADAQVFLSAPVVTLTGGEWQPTNATYQPGLLQPTAAQGASGTSALTVSADLITIRDEVMSGASARLNLAGPAVPDHWVLLPSFARIALNSTGDVRFDNGSLITSGDLSVTAAQIYPLSGKKGALIAGLITPNLFANLTYDPDRTLVIRGLGGVPNQPYSVFGSLLLAGGTVDQGGIVRAPLGTIAINTAANAYGSSYLYFPAWHLPGTSMPAGGTTILRDGSITSVSAAGLVIPYGGTVDGLTYRGADGTLYDVAATAVNKPNEGYFDSNSSDQLVLPQGIDVGGKSLIAEVGSVLDLSGGGELLGAGFISGRGGSVDILTTPLANANPEAGAYSQAGSGVYAILPSYASAYAPSIDVNSDAGDPLLGQQITLTTATGGLPSGTYTLLPSSFAMLPGAFRVEIGAQVVRPYQSVQLGAGTWNTSGALSTAGTGIRDALPSQILVTPGKNVRQYSQYNETGYAGFIGEQAALFSRQTPRLPSDGKILRLSFVQDDTATPLVMDGTALMSPTDEGYAGQLIAMGNRPIEIVDNNADPTGGMITLGAEDLSAFDAGALTIGGWSTYFDGGSSLGESPRIYFSGFGSQGGSVTIRDGATLTAGRIFLIGNQISVEGGAVLDTRGSDAQVLDSELGYVFANSLSAGQTYDTPAVLTVANGWLNFLPAEGQGNVTVADGASLLTDGTVAFVAPGTLEIGDVRLGARYLTVSQNQINIGSDMALATADADGALPAGWQLDQLTLDRLLRPADATVPALERLSLTGGAAVNFFGTVSLDAKTSDTQLVFNTPAFYGWGTDDDTVQISADHFVWNGLAIGRGTESSAFTSAPPAALLPGGPGWGTGKLVINANVVEFGYDALSRPQSQSSLERLAVGFSSIAITAADRITANSAGSLSVGRNLGADGMLQGGDLLMTTPLLTGMQGSQMAYHAGGMLTVVAPNGQPIASSAEVEELGASIELSGAAVSLDTSVALPSGKLAVSADGNIRLGENARLDLSGREIVFFDVSKYSWGGAATFDAGGDVAFDAGSTIDVSAALNAAGSITVAAGGSAALDGVLRGLGGATAGDEFADGSFGIGSGVLSGQAFDALNGDLNEGGFFQARRYVIANGDLTVGDGVRAHEVAIVVNGGSLGVTGRIDASGTMVGSIELAARGDLALGAGAVLDAHGTELETDSYGAAIDASNQARVDLTAVDGTVTLAGGATIDLRAADHVARGRIEINAPRLGGADGSGDGANDIAVSANGQFDIKGAASIAVNAFRRYELGGGAVIDQAYLDGIHGDSIAFIDAASANSPLQARLTGLTDYGRVFHLRPGVEIRSDGSLSTKGDLDLSGYRYGPTADPAIRGSGEPGVLTIRASNDLTINGSVNDGFAPPPATPDDNGWVVIKSLLLSGQATTEDLDFLAPYDPTYGYYYYFFPSFNSGEDYPVVTAGQIIDDEAVYNPGDAIYNGYLSGNVHIAAGTVLTAGDPANAQIVVNEPRAEPGRMWAVAPMLVPGSMSWSMRLVAGADTGAVDSRTLMPASIFGGGGGDLVLSDLHYVGNGTNLTSEAISVVRTGTGDLELLAGGDYRQTSPFGVYTAGTAVSEDISAPYQEQRAVTSDGTVLGAANAAFEATLNDRRMWLTTGGGDLTLVAQGNITGYRQSDAAGNYRTETIGDWLWRQGGNGLDQQTAWGVNFGSYVLDGTRQTGQLRLAGFSGIGALGGGNANVEAGGNIGVPVDEYGVSAGLDGAPAAPIVVAVAGSGRVDNGALVQTGGGDISIVAGGTVYGGVYSAIRGDTSVTATDIGRIIPINYGGVFGDPRALDPLTAYAAQSSQGVNFAPGDGTVTVETLGDLVLASVIDPGRVGIRTETQASAATADGLQNGSAASWFTLWTDASAINLISLGGDVSPFGSATNSTEITSIIPPSFSAMAAGGNLYFTAVNAELMPSPNGQIELLASGLVSGLPQNNVTARPGSVVVFGGAQSALATPLQPGWRLKDPSKDESDLLATNYWGPLVNGNQDAVDRTTVYQYSGYSTSPYGPGGALFMFGPNTVRDDSAAGDGSVVSRVYAVDGDILGLQFGVKANVGDIFQGTATTYYQSAKPVRILAGGDIVASSGLIVHYAPTDVSMIAAGGDILFSNFSIAGPGVLELTAGGDIYQGSTASLVSLGAVIPGDDRPGANIALQAGVGPGLPGEGMMDTADFAGLYLDPANRADPERPLADQPGKVVKTYEAELLDWLIERFGYDGGGDSALAYFTALPGEQQRIFLRQIYYAELRDGGREYSGKIESGRFGSYLRGRQAIAALFPEKNAEGNAIAYAGDIIQFGAAGIRTNFGGDISLLAPGGQVIVGVEGIVPPASSGLVTQGSGDIGIYSKKSVLLGLSRIMTTFGGNILAWSAEGDINAGRGAKTTVVFAPPRRIYDDLGNVSLAPTVPSSGAGIATLNPIPEVASGDVDLIAPLGTIDAGEAGIRVSGDINLAALHIVNAANIKVQGEATGIPQVVAVNTGALTAASAANNAVVAEATRLAERTRPEPIREMPTILNVRFLGFGPAE